MSVDAIRRKAWNPATQRSHINLLGWKINTSRPGEWPIYIFLFSSAALSIFTTIGIIFVLFDETSAFFADVSLVEFLTGTEWTPLIGETHYGVLPLLGATLLISFLAVLFAIPLGLLAAVYLSEYAHPRVRSIIKPILEILAGIPTIVYGFFALLFISPQVVQFLFGSDTSLFNALSAAIAMAIMILPLVSSLSEDAMRSVPTALREAAYGVGANKFEVATRVVMPGALSGIIAASILAVSRAIGETMIATLVAGGQPNLSWNPLEPMQTMTAYMVQVSLGETARGTIQYSSIFAVGATLFVVTLGLNVVAQWLLAKFREEYE